MNKISAQPENLVSIWGLDQPPRFPATPDGWDDITPFPTLPRPGTVGKEPFDKVVNHRSRRPATGALKKLTGAFPETFASASTALRAHEWRTLVHLDSFPLAALSNPAFDANKALIEILDRGEGRNDVPEEWTGSKEPTPCVLLDLRVVIFDLPPDVAKAVWSILGFARSVALEKNEVLLLPWWTSWWISRYIEFERRSGA